ncbi:hypothetical protein BX666DRAFT_241277 [Dichotomocladium elegans]|nr:hypothetical protein BX666DRAFT_241277 [Dichotomocladium elegans]
MRKEARIPTWLVQSLQASGTAANSSEASVRKPEIVPAPSEPSSPGRQCISSNMEKRPEEMRQTNPSFQLRLGEPKWMSRVNRTTHPTLYASSMDFISHVKARFAEEPERYRKIVGVIQKLGHFGTPKQQLQRSADYSIASQIFWMNFTVCSHSYM